MRPDKILALENDDYGRFGNNAYAKGFLQIYGRYLGVDTSDQFEELECVAPINVRDYQYLNNVPEPPKSSVRPQRQAGPPSILPLLVFFSFFIVAGLVIWTSVYYHRVFDSGESAKKSAITAPAKADGARSNQGQQSSEARDKAVYSQPNSKEEKPQPPRGAPAPAAAPSPSDNIEVRRAELVQQDASKLKRREPITPVGIVNEVVVEPIKKTWITVRRGSPDSTPIFDDFLYPGAPALKLHGTRFFVEVRDQSAVQILKNGNPIAYQAPGISIQ
jgi:cytoskeletal protein RodZ